MTDTAPSIICVGPSHKTASLAARERFAFVGSAGHELAGELLAHPDVLEVVALSTCNRSELYLVASDPDVAMSVAVAAFARLADADPAELSAMLAVWRDEAAVEHLFRVAAGIESVVVGEAEIQGQIKQALAEAQEWHASGPVLDRLFRDALTAGKTVRTQTGIGSGHASVGSVAAELVCRCLGDLDGRRVLLVGAGDVAELVARSLAARGAAQVYVANRSALRAERLASRFGGQVVPFEQLDAELAHCDVVVSSTNAPHPMLTRERVARAVRGRPLVLVDLAVPRDIEPGAGDLPGCHLYDLDDLGVVVADTRASRAGEVAHATDLVRCAAREFATWRRTLVAVPAIRALREHAERIRTAEFDRFAAKIGHLAPEDVRRIDQLTRSVVNKLLHQPTVRLRSEATATDARYGLGLWRAARELFNLDQAR